MYTLDDGAYAGRAYSNQDISKIAALLICSAILALLVLNAYIILAGFERPDINFWSHVFEAHNKANKEVISEKPVQALFAFAVMGLIGAVSDVLKVSSFDAMLERRTDFYYLHILPALIMASVFYAVYFAKKAVVLFLSKITILNANDFYNSDETILELNAWRKVSPSIIVRVADELWRDFVLSALSKKPIVIFDLRELSENIIWEIENVYATSREACICILDSPESLERIRNAYSENLSVINFFEFLEARQRIIFLKANASPLSALSKTIYESLSSLTPVDSCPTEAKGANDTVSNRNVIPISMQAVLGVGLASGCAGALVIQFGMLFSREIGVLSGSYLSGSPLWEAIWAAGVLPLFIVLQYLAKSASPQDEETKVSRGRRAKFLLLSRCLAQLLLIAIAWRLSIVVAAETTDIRFIDHGLAGLVGGTGVALAISLEPRLRSIGVLLAVVFMGAIAGSSFTPLFLLLSSNIGSFVPLSVVMAPWQCAIIIAITKLPGTVRRHTGHGRIFWKKI